MFIDIFAHEAFLYRVVELGTPHASSSTSSRGEEI
jgi:hypothetical protein